MPRDRDGSFEPKTVKKRQKRLTGIDEMVISWAVKGPTTGEVEAHLAEVAGAGDDCLLPGGQEFGPIARSFGACVREFGLLHEDAVLTPAHGEDLVRTGELTVTPRGDDRAGTGQWRGCPHRRKAPLVTVVGPGRPRRHGATADARERPRGAGGW